MDPPRPGFEALLASRRRWAHIANRVDVAALHGWQDTQSRPLPIGSADSTGTAPPSRRLMPAATCVAAFTVQSPRREARRKPSSLLQESDHVSTAARTIALVTVAIAAVACSAATPTASPKPSATNAASQ